MPALPGWCLGHLSWVTAASQVLGKSFALHCSASSTLAVCSHDAACFPSLVVVDPLPALQGQCCGISHWTLAAASDCVLVPEPSRDTRHEHESVHVSVCIGVGMEGLVIPSSKCPQMGSCGKGWLSERPEGLLHVWLSWLLFWALAAAAVQWWCGSCQQWQALWLLGAGN